MPDHAVYRIEVRPKLGTADPRGEAARRDAISFGLPDPPARIDTAAVYLIQGVGRDLSPEQVDQVAEELLADPVTEEALVGAAPIRAEAIIEVHPLPGVMDPDAQAVEMAIRAMLGADVRVRTGRRYDLHGSTPAAAKTLAERCLANTVVHAVFPEPYHPRAFPTGAPQRFEVRSVPLRTLGDEQLLALSREAHLFLSLEEMKAIREEYRTRERDPREIELETLAQTWSEHCVHKTFRSSIRYRGRLPGALTRPGVERHDDGSVTIHNLFKSTIAAATSQLIERGVDWCLSVFHDNAGIIAFDEEHAVCFKCETHNHPSAIEPYGGAATGIGGCIRDILGTGLAARPVAATDVFCVAPPDHEPIPAGCLHPRRILSQVVGGVRDYGNRMGIPTVNGTVWFDPRYVGNPLVYCGCVGVMPLDRIHGEPRAGDRIVALGGRTGRDGIHGATFSSSELTDTHAEEFSHAVQIGNAVTEKTLQDAILAARDSDQGCLYHAITDCGAGGFSSAVGEMGQALGAEVHLDRAPLKYEGLTPTEIWISEAQERMVLAVPPGNVEALSEICRLHDVEVCDLGHFGTDGAELVLLYESVEVGRLPVEFLHEGRPDSAREATWSPPAPPTVPGPSASSPPSTEEALLALLAHPNIASKHWIIRQYDHEVQGGSVVKPLVGPRGEGPSDGAVIQPVAGSETGLAIANGLATGFSADPYLMALAAIDECVRNLVCVGADAGRIALLDNFCWPSCGEPEALGGLVRAALGCYDGALAYRAPFISGKDSLNNQFVTESGETIRIPPTLLISGIGLVHRVERCVTMDAKEAGDVLLLVGRRNLALGGSHYLRLFDQRLGEVDRSLPWPDLTEGPAAAAAVSALIEGGLVRAAHDCSEGGVLVAAAEMALAGGVGLQLELGELLEGDADQAGAVCFGEAPGRYLLEIAPRDLDRVRAATGHLAVVVIGRFDEGGRLRIPGGDLDVRIDGLIAAWRGTLDW